MNEGASVLAYQSSSVPYGQSCVSETRGCSSGVLSGSYTFATCGVGLPMACMFNGTNVAHGASVAAYATSTVGFGQSCAMEVRTCDNGLLSGSYTYASCSVGQPAACMFNGMTIAHGASVNAFASSAVPYDQSCAMQTRTCNNGQLSGSYTYASCSVGQPAACMFNGMTVAHGASVVAYQAPTVPAGQNCSGVAQTRTCSNGTLSGSATYPSCAMAMKTCTLAYHGSFPADGTLIGSAVESSTGDPQACGSYCASVNANACTLLGLDLSAAGKGFRYYCAAWATTSATTYTVGGGTSWAGTCQ